MRTVQDLRGSGECRPVDIGLAVQHRILWQRFLWRRSPQTVDRSRTFHHINVFQPQLSPLLVPWLHRPFNPAIHSDAHRTRWTMPRQFRHQTTHIPQEADHPFFCACGGTNPAHSLRILLLRAGIESNPGPPCDTCGANAEAQLTCAAEGCNKVCHKRPGCSRISDALESATWLCQVHNPIAPPEAQACDSCGTAIPAKAKRLVCNFAEGCSRVCHKKPECSRLQRKALDSTPWFCELHNSSPPADDAFQAPTRLSATNKKCPACNLNLKSNPFVCTLCHTGYHQVSCSGIENRYQRMRIRKSWICPKCDTTTDAPPLPISTLPPPPTQRRISPVPLAPSTDPSMVTPASSSQPPKPHCLSCKKKLVSSWLTCNICDKSCHQKEACSGLSTRDARENAKKKKDFQCQKCLSSAPPTQPLPSSDDILQKSEPKARPMKRPLRILQWNAEGLNPKMTEFKCFLQEYKIDVALVQETKLTPKSATPAVKGYAPVRGDRLGAEFPGGGLLTYINEDIPSNPTATVR